MTGTVTINGREFPVVSYERGKPVLGPPLKKRTKYGNRKVVVGGITFDSHREHSRYVVLKMMQIKGEIRDLALQPTFILAPGVKIAGEARKRPAVRYSADFTYVEADTGRTIVEDVKSTPTAKSKEFRRIQHLMKSVHGIDVRIVK